MMHGNQSKVSWCEASAGYTEGRLLPTSDGSAKKRSSLWVNVRSVLLQRNLRGISASVSQSSLSLWTEFQVSTEAQEA